MGSKLHGTRKPDAGLLNGDRCQLELFVDRVIRSRLCWGPAMIEKIMIKYVCISKLYCTIGILRGGGLRIQAPSPHLQLLLFTY